VIAAGFDPLLAILSQQHRDIVFFELDHPATQKAKANSLKKLNQSDNLILIPVDLTRKSIFDALLNTQFSPQKKTLFIAEGITMYLNEIEIIKFFEQIKLCTSHKSSHLIFTYMNKQKSGSIQFGSATKLADYWLWLKKETFKWGIETDNLSNFLSTLGFHLVNLFDSNDLAQKYLADKKLRNIKLATGENICVARSEP
jgi:methyltransferase (TIGR00027 family)